MVNFIGGQKDMLTRKGESDAKFQWFEIALDGSLGGEHVSQKRCAPCRLIGLPPYPHHHPHPHHYPTNLVHFQLSFAFLSTLPTMLQQDISPFSFSKFWVRPQWLGSEACVGFKSAIHRSTLWWRKSHVPTINSIHIGIKKSHIATFERESLIFLQALSQLC